MSNSQSPSCAKCGAELAAFATEGFCSACLLERGLSSETPAVAPPPLSHFGNYELIEEIARGGMGVVYKARQAGLDRLVAVKMILSGQFASAAEMQRFRAEARAAAALQHPGIVAIHEVGEHEGLLFFSMDYVEGRNLAELVRDGPLPATRAAHLVREIAEAIHYAHERGVLHRDLKPSNVLIDTEGKPHVTDFGLAKRLAAAEVTKLTRVGHSLESAATEEFTLTGQVLGSPNFMPPEQAAGKHRELTPVADVYSLGALLYHLLTGRPPFLADNIPATLRLVAETEPVALRLLAPGVPRDLETICLKCLEKDPGRRYGTARSLSEELNRFLNGRPIQARPVPAAEKLARWCGRHPAIAGLIVALAFVLGAGFISVWWEWRRADASARMEASQRENNRQRLVRVNVATGSQMLEQNDYLGALPWFLEALKLDAGLRQREENHRLRIAAVLQQTPRLVHAWFHQGPVRHAEFSRDGRKVLTASQDGTARVWDVASGNQVALLQHSGGIGSASFNPDATLVATACADGHVTVWSVVTGEQLFAPMMHTSAVNQVSFSQDGVRIISASEDGTAQIWNAATGRPTTPPLKHEGGVKDACFSPDGRLAATISSDTSIRIWDGVTGEQLHRHSAFSRFVYAVAFSPDGHKVIGASWGNAIVLDAATGKDVFPPLKHLQGVTSASFSIDGERIVSSSEDQTVRVWDARSGREISLPFRHAHAVTQARFDTTGHWVITACDDGVTRIWDMATGEQLTTKLKQAGTDNIACFSPDGALALAAGSDGVVRIWDLMAGQSRNKAVEYAGDMRHASIDSNGRWLITSGVDYAQVWDPLTGEKVGAPLRHRENYNVTDAAFSRDGEWVATASEDRTARIWERVSGRPVTEPLLHDGPLIRVQFNSPGTHVVTVSGVNLKSKGAQRDATIIQGPVKIQTWSRAAGTPLTEPLVLDQAIGTPALSADARLVASPCRDNSMRVWETATGRLVLTCSDLGGRPDMALFRSDGEILLTATIRASAGEVRLWNIKTGKALPMMIQHRSVIANAAFSPDGHRIVTASLDGTARIWNAVTGDPITPPLVHNWIVFDAAFSPDGRHVVTGSGDHTARVWDAQTGEPLGPPLKHRGYVCRVAFTGDGRQIFAGLTQSINVTALEHSAYLWPLNGDDRPLPALQQLAQLLSGQHIDATGSLVPVDPKTLPGIWSAVRSKYPDQFHPVPDPSKNHLWEQSEYIEVPAK